MTTPKEQAAALVRAYREGRYMAHDLRTEKAETLAALLELVEAQRWALEEATLDRDFCELDPSVTRLMDAALALTDPEEEGRG